MSGADTLVTGPYPEFVMMAAKRIVSDELRMQFAASLVTQSRIIESLNGELDFTQKGLGASIAREEQQQKVVAPLRARLDKSDLKNASLRPWATIGKVVVVSIGVTAISVGAIAIVSQLR